MTFYNDRMTQPEKRTAADVAAAYMGRSVVTYHKPSKCTDHNRLVVTLDDGSRGFMFHRTMIAHISEDGRTITLDNGEWFSPTTKKAMNEALREFGISRGHVYQEKKQWYAFGKQFPSSGKIVLHDQVFKLWARVYDFSSDVYGNPIAHFDLFAHGEPVAGTNKRRVQTGYHDSRSDAAFKAARDVFPDHTIIRESHEGHRSDNAGIQVYFTAIKKG